MVLKVDESIVKCPSRPASVRPYQCEVEMIDIAVISGLLFVLVFHDLVCPYIIFSYLSMSLRIQLTYAGACLELEQEIPDSRKGGLSVYVMDDLEGQLELYRNGCLSVVVELPETKTQSFQMSYYNLPLRKPQV
jgi:hypothetical protein